MPEVQRLLRLADEPQRQRRFHQWWSSFRRRHQATARRCHATTRETQQAPLLEGRDSVLLDSTTRALDDALWEQIAQVLPRPRRRGDEPPLEYRTLLAGILWVAATGASWQDIPSRYGPWETVKAAYYRWKQHGQWPKVLTLLQSPPPSPSNVSL